MNEPRKLRPAIKTDLNTKKEVVDRLALGESPLTREIKDIKEAIGL